MERKAFGKLADGEEATLYTISNTKGMYAQITDFGASIVSLVVKDKDGKNTDVVLGYENAETYQQQMASFGAVVGRNCNRIANAEIVIDGVTYQLEKNDNENNLHSGSQATSRRLWDAEEQTADKITFVIKDAEGQQAYLFHQVLAEQITAACIEARSNSGRKKVALSGGVFQNRLLLRLTEEQLEQEGFEVLRHHMIPPNDGGIAIGQAAYGMWRLNNHGLQDRRI